MAEYPLLPYSVCILAESVIYVWLYNNPRGSLLILALARAVTNVVGFFSSAPVASATITAVVAVLLVVVFGPTELSRTGNRVVLARTAELPQESR